MNSPLNLIFFPSKSTKMTDYYKIALEILYKILKDSDYDFWAKWMLEDIELWATKKSVEHHLHAYGGMGSFNDISVGNDNVEGLWKNKVFGAIQTIAYSLAKGEVFEEIIDENFQYNTNEISGWRCRDCGDARINKLDIERYISAFFVPKFFVEYVKQNKFIDIAEISKLIDNQEVTKKRRAIEALIKSTNITLAANLDWLWICPKCQSKEVCAYRWLVLDEDTKLIEGNDNLEVNKNISL